LCFFLTLGKDRIEHTFWRRRRHQIFEQGDCTPAAAESSQATTTNTGPEHFLYLLVGMNFRPPPTQKGEASHSAAQQMIALIELKS